MRRNCRLLASWLRRTFSSALLHVHPEAKHRATFSRREEVNMEGLRQVFLDFTSFGAGQSGSSEMDSAKFVKLAKVRRLMCRRDIHTSINRTELDCSSAARRVCRMSLQRNANKEPTSTIPERVLRFLLQAALLVRGELTLLFSLGGRSRRCHIGESLCQAISLLFGGFIQCNPRQSIIVSLVIPSLAKCGGEITPQSGSHRSANHKYIPDTADG